MAKTHRRLGYGLAAALFVADQITKAIIIGPIGLQQAGQIYLLPILNLTWVENYGIALGMLQAGHDAERWLLVAATTAIAAFVGFWIRKEENRFDVAGLGLVLGGALGNRCFPAFNVADSAISAGAAMILLDMIRPSSGPAAGAHAG